MNITVNGERRPLPAAITLSELLEELSLPERRVAVELNKAVVPKTNWESVMLDDGDTLEIIHFVGGG